jgi:sirohydrochlorin cobaltochelatase
MTQRDPSTGLLVVGHGTREPEGCHGVWRIAAEVERLAQGTQVELGFLEFVRPRIGEALHHLVDRGVSRVVVAPLFLFAAGHVKRDIPRAVGEALARHSQVAWHQAPHVGVSPVIARLSARRLAEALSGCPPRPWDETVVLVVGRGNRDSGALGEMRSLVAVRQRQAPALRIEPCFLAMAGPSLEESLPRLAASDAHRIVVQPHLLLPGKLTRRIAACVERARLEWPHKEWVVTGPLGPDPLLAEALLAQAEPWLAPRSALFEPGFRSTMH